MGNRQIKGMFLRPDNDDLEAKGRIAALNQRIQVLLQSMEAEPSNHDAPVRLELARIYWWNGSYRASLDLLEPLTDPKFDIEIQLEAAGLIAENHLRHDQFDLANSQFEENLKRANAVGNEFWAGQAEQGLAWVLIAIGHFMTGEYDQSKAIFERQVDFAKRVNKPQLEGFAFYGMSRSIAGIGHYTEAIKWAVDSVEILKLCGAHHLLQLPLLQLANVHRDRGDFEEARGYYLQAVDAADRSQDAYVQVLTALEYGVMLGYVNEGDHAIQLWRMALPIAIELNFPRLAEELCRRLSALAAARSQFEDAYRLKISSLEYGNQVGVISSILHSQKMLLREQMHHAAQLQASLRYLEAGVEASVDGIFILVQPSATFEKDDLLIKFANESAAEILGVKPVNIHHVLMKSAWRSATSELLLRPSRDVFATGEPCTLDPIHLEFIPGHWRWYSVKIARIPEGVVWTVSDVNAREAMQQEIVAQRDHLELANCRLTALDREKSEMLGIAAHDLRSPIGNIRSLCELITSDDPENCGLLETIEEIADSLLQLIENLLDVERIERGELDLEPIPLNVGPVASHLAEHFSAEAHQKRIELAIEIEAQNLEICADESALKRILQNLISNALKFSPPGSKVWIRALDRAEKVRIEIKDQGVGISEADRQKLFGKFARLTARPTGGESSTGLGLSIVKRLVEAMDGSVDCDSVPGHGATFWVEFGKLSVSSPKAAA